jgi:N-acetylmuramoyl-L-alanine amidase
MHRNIIGGLSVCADPSGRVVPVNFKVRRSATKLSKITVCAVAFALCCSLRAAESSTTPAAKSAPVSMADASKSIKEYYAALSGVGIPAALANGTPASEKFQQGQSHEEEEAASNEELKNQGDMRIEIPPAGSTSKPSVPPAKSTHKNSGDFVVALDIGHTPSKGGAISARGVSEYEFNYRLVIELFEQLQSLGFRHSFVINPKGEEIRLAQRSAEANAQNADLFLAIHHDSVKDSFLKTWEVNGKKQKYCDNFHGYSIFFSHKNAKATESFAFASKLGQGLLQTGFTPTLHHVAQENRPIIDKGKGIYAFDDLVVLKTARMPAVLLECGVIVNRTEEENLNRPAYRKRLADAICRAVQDFSTGGAKDD